MTQKTLGLALVVLGLVLLAVSLAADLLGWGARAGMGWKQWTGMAIGALMFFVGLWLALRKVSPPK